MARSQEDIAADLDALEASDRSDADDVEDGQGDGDQTDDNQDPPGYMNHEEWIAAGKNPDDFRGKNAYKSQYDNIQDNKSLKNDVQELKGMLTDVVDAAEETRQQQAAAHKADLQAKLDEQMESMEPKEAIEKQREIDAIDTSAPALKIDPVISTFIAQNPILDPDSSEFNADFAKDHISFHNAGAEALGGRTSPLSSGQILKVMNKAMEQAKDLNPDLFKSSRNSRGGANRGGKGKGNQATGKLSEYKIDDDSDPRNQNAATAMYEMIKKKSPEKAEQFRKNLVGG